MSVLVDCGRNSVSYAFAFILMRVFGVSANPDEFGEPSTSVLW